MTLAFLGTRPRARISSTVTSLPASNAAARRATFTPYTSTRLLFTKPRFGTRRWMGFWPPSDPTRTVLRFF